MSEDASLWVPADAGVAGLRRAARSCRGCEAWRQGTQTVFGEGPTDAAIMLVGEQPGDREDLDGRPFVGPAGRVLDRALDRIGLGRDDVYLTNAVKHFRWEQRGKRRLHRKPSLAHIRACAPWLREELRVVAPDVLVLMGATAAQALLGSGFRVTEHRGEIVETDLPSRVTATVHPSSILRVADRHDREASLEAFVHDLEVVAGSRGRR